MATSKTPATPDNALPGEVESLDSLKISAASKEQTASGTPPNSADDIPDGGYGWIVVISTIFLNVGTWGVSSTYGVYNSYYIQHNYFAGGTPLRYAFVGGLSIGLALLMAPLSNFLCKQYHFKVPLIIGGVFIVLGQCLAGIATNFGFFLAMQGIVFGCGLGLTMVPAQPLAAHWFSRRLALAQGLGAAGSGAGTLLFSNVTRKAIDSIGIKWALIANGCCSLAILIPIIILLRARHRQVQAKSQPLQISFLWHKGFVFVWLYGAFARYFIALFSMASYASEALGLSQTKAASLQSILGAGQMIGRPIIGYALDRGGRINMTILAQLIGGISAFAFWLPAKGYGLLVVFAIVQGLVGGTVWSATAPISASVVGVQDLASALGIFWIINAAPACLSDPIAVALIDYSRNHLDKTGRDAYLISVGLCGAFFTASALVLFGAKFYVQKNTRIFVKA